MTDVTSAPWLVAAGRDPAIQSAAQQVATALAAAIGSPVEVEPVSADDAESVREAVRAGRCRLAVHDHARLPLTGPADLVVGAIPTRIDPRDALVSAAGHRLAELPRNRPVAVGAVTGLARAQLQRHRRDVLTQPVAGDVGDLLMRVADQDLDAVVVPVATLLRLRPAVAGLVAVPLEHGELLHAPGQGALAVECRRDDAAARKALARIDDRRSRSEVAAERELLVQLGGGEPAPVGAHAEHRRTADGGERLVLLGLIADERGTRLHRASHETAPTEAVTLGRAMAATLLEAGGDRLLGWGAHAGVVDHDH